MTMSVTWEAKDEMNNVHAVLFYFSVNTALIVNAETMKQETDTKAVNTALLGSTRAVH